MAIKPKSAPKTFAALEYKPYAIALGQIALAWNYLHEVLGLLYATILDGGYYGQTNNQNALSLTSRQHLAVWHAIKVDRTQREMLLAAIRSNNWGSIPANLEDDIEWICARANAVENIRNDSLHSPLLAFKKESGGFSILPVTGFGHVRAKNLSNAKNILKEFRWCRDAATCLSLFAEKIDDAVMDPMRPWPNRPQLPNRGDTNSSKRRPRAVPAKPPRRPQSSSA